jgi:hypothetical protein
MIEYKWFVLVDGVEEEVVWDSVSQMLLAPPLISLTAEKLVESGEIVLVTPVGPRVQADLEEHLSAWATISYAIELCGYVLVDGSVAPITPESELVAGNPANE